MANSHRGARGLAHQRPGFVSRVVVWMYRGNPAGTMLLTAERIKSSASSVQYAHATALPNDSIRGIVIIDEGLIVATGNGIFKSIDKGRQWTPLNKALTNLSIQVMTGGGTGPLYAGTSSGVFRSDDVQSWVAVNQGLDAGLAPPPFRFR